MHCAYKTTTHNIHNIIVLHQKTNLSIRALLMLKFQTQIYTNGLKPYLLTNVNVNKLIDFVSMILEN